MAAMTPANDKMFRAKKLALRVRRTNLDPWVCPGCDAEAHDRTSHHPRLMRASRAAQPSTARAQRSGGDQEPIPIGFGSLFRYLSGAYSGTCRVPCPSHRRGHVLASAHGLLGPKHAACQPGNDLHPRFGRWPGAGAVGKRRGHSRQSHVASVPEPLGLAKHARPNVAGA